MERCLPFLGELTQGIATTVELPDNAFCSVINIRTRMYEYIRDHPEKLLCTGMPYLPNDKEDTTINSTRSLMYLPGKYASLLLRPSGYDIREVWDILIPAIIAENDLVTCLPLITWLRIASTSMQLANNAQGYGPPACALTLTVPMADQCLINHRMALLKQVLPALNKPSDSLELAITQMATAVTHSMNNARLNREQKEAQANTPKLPSDKFTIMLPVLQQYLDTDDERNLPELWHLWANCSKKQEFNILSETLQAYARSPNAFLASALVVTLKLVQDLLSFTFVGDILDDIKTGLQPFAIADGSLEHRQANLELSHLYGFLNAGEQSFMFADLKALKSKEVQSIPLNYYKLKRNLGMFGNLLGTILGDQHVLTMASKRFWQLLSQGYHNKIQQIIDTKHYIKPTYRKHGQDPRPLLQHYTVLSYIRTYSLIYHLRYTNLPTHDL